MVAQQFVATVKKNLLEKRRNIRVTFCECFSHLGMIVIMALGVTLSKIVFYQAENYVKFDLLIPNNVVLPAEGSEALLTDDNVALRGGTAGDSIDGKNQTISNRLISFSFMNFYGGLFRQLKGPMLIPSFDLFVTVAQTFTNLGRSIPQLKFYLQNSKAGQLFGNILEFGDLHFAPRSKATMSLILHLNTTTSSFRRIKSYVHESEDDAVKYILNHLDQRTFALVVIRDIQPHRVNYVLRMNYTTLPNTNSMIESVARGLNKGYQGYQLSGFLTMEQTVDQWALNYALRQVDSKASCTVPDVVTVPMPTFAFDTNLFYASVGALLGLVLTMSTLYPVSRLVKTVVEEKETKMREVMKIMGLTDSAHHLSWFFTAFLNFFWIALSTTFVVHVSFLPNSNVLLLFLYFFLFNMSEINLAFLISVFFSNSKLAAIVGPVILFVTILPKYIFFGSNSNEAVAAKYVASILSPTAFTFGADILSSYEYSKIGVQVSNMYDGDFSFSSVLIMMFFDIFLYGFLAWYLDLVISHDVGTSKHPLFLFMPSYWIRATRCIWRCFGGQEVQAEMNLQVLPPEMISREATLMTVGSEGEVIVPSEAGMNVEKLSDELVTQVRVVASRLRKMYPNGKLAVHDFSVAMVEGQITCLLGHNGAGKSSVIAMITGLTTMTEGECNIYGFRMPGDLEEVRRLTGICPQQNVLFPSLTVHEHLWYFGIIKGLYGARLTEEVDRLIQEVGLGEKRHIPSSSLSGGMKRKLQLSMALIGGSKFVLLDEPTSGMDPYSRRSTWELLQRMRADRVIVLTTHFLEEADILGDRIAIMSEGVVRCSGSSLYLKTRFGAGYVLSMAKTSGWGPENSLWQLRQVEDLVRTYVPAAVLTSHVAGEIIFSLPLESVPVFGELFNALQGSASELRIGSYGVALTSLEQVFIRLAKEAGHTGDELPTPSWLEKYTGKMQGTVTRALGFRYKQTRDTDTDGEMRLADSQMEVDAMADAGKDVGGQGSQSDLADLYVRHGVADYVSDLPEGSVGGVGGVGGTGHDRLHEDKMMVDVDLDAPDEWEEHKSQEGFSALSSSSASIVVAAAVVIDERSAKGIPDPIPSPDNVTRDWDLMLRTGDWRIQMFELIRKRYIAQSRDLKGFFFQIVFPAIQILLILAILTITINPAGRTVRMNASIYDPFFRGKPVNVIVAGQDIGPGSLADYLSPARLNVIRYKYNNSDGFASFNLASDLKDSGNAKFRKYKQLVDKFPAPPNRLASLILDDKIPINIHVQWDWVKAVIPFILKRAGGDIITAASEVLGIDLSKTLQLGLGSVRIPVPALALVGLIGRNATESQVAAVRRGIRRVRRVSNATEDALERAFNATLRAVTSTGLINQTILVDFTLSADGVDIDKNNGDLILKQVTLSDRGFSYNIGDVRVSLQTLLSYAPNGYQEYVYKYPASVTVMFNSSSQHGIAAFRGEVVAAAFQRCYDALPLSVRDRALHPNVTYVAKNHPLPLTARQALEIKVVLALLASVFILVPLCYIPGSFVTFVVRERTSKAKHLQLVSSVSPYLYWFATLVWDMMLFAILVLLIMVALFCYGTSASQIFISSSEGGFCVFFLLLCYGQAVLPLCYLYSLMFENHSTAQISIMAINFMTGFVAVLAYFVMSNIPLTKAAAAVAVHFFRFFPPYLVGEGLINISTNAFMNIYFGTEKSFFGWFVAGRCITFLVAEAAGYFLWLLLTEAPFIRDCSNWLQKQRALLALRAIERAKQGGRGDPGAGRADGEVPHATHSTTATAVDHPPDPANPVPDPPDTETDDDVLRERAVVASADKAAFALCIDGLVKVYPPSFLGGAAKHAVRGLTLACPPGERFGFLGINGAGKSSTLNVLTGDIAPTGGEVFIAGHPLSDPNTRLAIGYCPQTDPLFDLLTASETLWFYGRIRGIEPDELRVKVDALIEQVGLAKFAHRCSGTYSGGNKRKLSLAISLIGSPRVLLLDEPSSGMDAFARRQMWDVIAVVSQERSVVLTTHSMEECEALCTRIGMMVDGSFRCLGSAQHLKDLYGTGYQIEIRFVSEGRYAEVLRLCRDLCADISVEEKHGKFLRLNAPTLDLGEAFRTLEAAKGTAESAGCLVDYTISQNTLEQVFIKFAKLQEAEEGKDVAQGSSGVVQPHMVTAGTFGLGSESSMGAAAGVGLSGAGRGMGIVYGADGRPQNGPEAAILKSLGLDTKMPLLPPPTELQRQDEHKAEE